MAPTTSSSSRITTLDDLTHQNIGLLKKLNTVLFPVPYSEKFYKESLTVGELAKLAYFRDVCVGAVRCQYEPPSDDPSNRSEGKIYIMTLGVLAPYRRLGIGSTLLDHVLSQAKNQTRSSPAQPVKSLYLHVQTTNQEALDWYTKRGFAVEDTVKDYYRNIDDREAHVLVRKLED